MSVNITRFLMMVKVLFHLDYRGLEGFNRSMKRFLPGLKVADYTTTPKRFKRGRIELGVAQLYPQAEVAVDASGLKVTNRGEYRRRTRSQKGFLKIHLAVDIRSHEMLALEVTTEKVADGDKFFDLMEAVGRKTHLTKTYGDGAYDRYLHYEYCRQKGISAVIRPRLSAIVQEGTARGEVVQEFLDDPSAWKRKHSYGQRWQVETVFSVWKRKFGEAVFSKAFPTMRREVILKATLLNFLMNLSSQN